MNNNAKYIDTRRFKSHTPCPMCGSSVAVGDLFCVKCGMRIHSHQYRKSVTAKANLRSIYIFYNERDYDNTKDAIYYGNRIVYNKLNWYGDWRNINGYDYVWRIDLYDDLTQEELEYAVGHIREHNGLFYRE